MARADVVVTLNVQTQSGDEISVEEAERLWLNGLYFGDKVPETSYQRSSHLTEADDSYRDDLMNVMFSDANHGLVDAAAMYGSAVYGVSEYGVQSVTAPPIVISLPLPFSRCQFHVRIEADKPIAITSTKFYAYDGIADVNPYRGIVFKAAEGGVSTAWISANGASQGLVCANHTSALAHDYYVAVSASPTDTGDKQGKVKFVFTYSE